MSDLKKRTITAAILIVVFIPLVFFGGLVFDIVVGLFALGASFELERMFKKENKFNFLSIFSMALSTLTYIFIILMNYLKEYKYIFMWVILVFLLIGIIGVLHKDSNVDTISRHFLTIYYPSLGFSSLAILRNMETSIYRNGLFILLYPIIICIMTDMFAYFFGCKFGKHKLCPSISPKKSIEGSIAGTAFSLLFGVFFIMISGGYKVLFPSLQPMWALFASIPLTLFISFIDEIGDLFASRLKRFYGIKDYSQIFPGHGGILDRFDSYIFACSALLVYILLVL